MQNHLYVEHKTYTGPGCAMCGKGIEDHPGSATTEETTKFTFEVPHVVTNPNMPRDEAALIAPRIDGGEPQVVRVKALKSE